jgi:hypothetical protein
VSFQAVTWALQQKTGGTSGKATLLSIANYAGETWCSWPSQGTVASESEQSVDSVQRRYRELADKGLVRRVPMRFAGRKTVDFLILAPSPFFQSGLAEIEAILPRGCEIDARAAAADCGSDTNATSAESGAIEPPQSEGPQIEGAQVAVAVTAMVRQQEPSTLNQEERDARTREGEAEPHLPHAALLEELIAKCPTAAWDSRAEIEAEWRRLSPDERREATARYEEWFAGAKKLGRGKPHGLPAYLREKRWTLIGAAKSGQPAETTIPAWSRAWCYLAHEFIRTNAVNLRRHDSAASQNLRSKFDLARTYAIGWRVPAEKAAAIESAAAGLVQAPKDGAVAAMWVEHYRRQGVSFPLPDKAEWIFVPPGNPEGTSAEEDPAQVVESLA